MPASVAQVRWHDGAVSAAARTYAVSALVGMSVCAATRVIHRACDTVDAGSGGGTVGTALPAATAR